MSDNDFSNSSVEKMNQDWAEFNDKRKAEADELRRKSYPKGFDPGITR